MLQIKKKKKSKSLFFLDTPVLFQGEDVLELSNKCVTKKMHFLHQFWYKILQTKLK